MLPPVQRGGFAQAAHGGTGVCMGDGHAQAVGCVRARQAWQLLQPPHHFLHLAFGGAAVADHGFFHLQRGVFGHG